MTEKPYNTLNDLTYKTFLSCVKQRETKNLTEKSKMKVKNEEKKLERKLRSCFGQIIPIPKTPERFHQAPEITANQIQVCSKENQYDLENRGQF